MDKPKRVRPARQYNVIDSIALFHDLDKHTNETLAVKCAMMDRYYRTFGSFNVV